MTEMVDAGTLELLREMSRVAQGFARKGGSAAKGAGHVGAKALKGTVRIGGRAVKGAGHLGAKALRGTARMGGRASAAAAGKGRVAAERGRQGLIGKGRAGANRERESEHRDAMVRSASTEKEALALAAAGFAELNESFFIRSTGEELESGLEAYAAALRAGWSHADMMLAAAYYSDWCAAQAAAGNAKNAPKSCAQWLEKPEKGKSGLESSAAVAQVGPGFDGPAARQRDGLIYAATDDQRREILSKAEGRGFDVFAYDTTVGELNEDRAFWRYTAEEGRDTIVTVYELVPSYVELGIDPAVDAHELDRATGNLVFEIEGEKVEVPRPDFAARGYLESKYSLAAHEAGAVEAPHDPRLDGVKGRTEFVADTPEASAQVRGYLNEMGIAYDSSPIPGSGQVIISIENRELAENAVALAGLAEMSRQEIMGMHPEGESPAEVEKRRLQEAVTLARRFGPARGQEARAARPKEPERTPAQDQIRAVRAAREVNRGRAREIKRNIDKAQER